MVIGMDENGLRDAIAAADLHGLPQFAIALGIEYEALRKRVQRGDPTIEAPVVWIGGPQWTATQVERMRETVERHPRRGRPPAKHDIASGLDKVNDVSLGTYAGGSIELRACDSSAG